ncbi:hypothetical protein LguiA_029378 [Lonicera macranthoides]
MDMANCYLDGNADVVEFCPHDSYHNILAAATYTLEEGDKPSRSGSISLFNVDASLGQLELIHRAESAGIFDLKWNPVGSNNVSPLLAQANADGYLRLDRLESSVNGSELHGNFLKEVDNEKVSSSMCLCLDWNPSATSIAVGLSDGSTSIISLNDSGPNKVQEWEGHEFEVWATCFDIHQPQLVYTGSDDCKFKCWDLRMDSSELAFQNSKAHTMGVCCIAKNPSDPYTLLTGSYDEYLRIWDVRSMSKPISKTSICLGGGVWRIKYHPSVVDIVVAACMHNGFSIVKVNGDKPEVVETYNKHESLAYGVDWQGVSLCKDGKRKSSVVATCSFYDRLLRVWMPKNDIVI